MPDELLCVYCLLSNQNANAPGVRDETTNAFIPAGVDAILEAHRAGHELRSYNGVLPVKAVTMYQGTALCERHISNIPANPPVIYGYLPRRRG